MILLFAGNENNTSDRQLSETLYRAALDAYLENTKRRVSGKDCERTAGVHGKPAAAGLPGFHFNISHSGGIGVCALSDRPVGADLQRIPKDPGRCLRIARHFYSETEVRALEALSGRSEDLCALFCRLWTARESFVKCTGEGLSRDFRSFCPDLQKGVIRTVISKTGDHASSAPEGGQYYIREYPAPDGYVLTVCSQAPLTPAPQCRWTDL
ncbi:MAG: 4'-phosphopantetheinyl transferase superfamily protein [Lachnospiraceae bacterium]|nr:4'-phosphopantetheinyl transferase superfamily protein [Lachnospiraceae bacterium]